MTRKRPVTLVEYLFRSLGYRKGTKAAAFIVAWGIYADSVGDGERPGMHGYAKYWKQSVATSYRELEVFREAFPEDPFPDRVWAMIREHVETRKSRSVATAQALPVLGRWASDD